MTESKINWTPEQQKAIDHITAWMHGETDPMLSLSGAAGAGKTTLLCAVKDSFPGAVSWTAMTGKAALRLAQVANVKAGTLHSTLYEPPNPFRRIPDFSKVKKPDCKFLVIDEASMLTPKIYMDLDNWLKEGVKVLFVGDGYQLPPILTPKEIKEFGEDFIIFSVVKGPTLSKVMRSGDGVIDVATHLRREGSLPAWGNSAVDITRVKYPGLKAISNYLEDSNDHALITWRNKMRMQGNAEIRRKLGRKSFLPEAGEPVLICRNGQDVLNGEIVEAASFSEGFKLAEVNTYWMKTSTGQEIFVSTDGKEQPMDGSLPDVKDWKEYHYSRNSNKLPEPIPVTYGYVLTAHKAQGSEFNRVSVYLSDTDLRSRNFNFDTKLPSGETMSFGARWTYTALTRSKSRCSIIIGE